MIEIGWEEKVYPAAKIAIIVDGLAAEGVSSVAALQGVGLSPDELRSPATLVWVTQVVVAYRNALRLSRHPDFAFQSGLRTHIASYGMYGFAILSSMDFRQTMRFAVRYHPLATPLVKLHFAEEGRWAAWTIDPRPHPGVDERLYRFIVDIQLGIIVSLHRDVMGSSFRPAALEVTFEAPQPGSQEHYERVFGCAVAFRKPANRLLFNADWLDETPGFGNEVTYASVLSLCDDLHDQLKNRLGVAGKVRGVLIARLGRNLALEDVATKIEIPERTLRRKLREEGTSFREIVDQLRAEVAVKYLRDTQMTIDDIASALGFSESANFRHAFRRWKRASPRDYRQALQDERLKAGGRRIGRSAPRTTANQPILDVLPPLAPSAQARLTRQRNSAAGTKKPTILSAWPEFTPSWPIGTFCDGIRPAKNATSDGNGKLEPHQ